MSYNAKIRADAMSLNPIGMWFCIGMAFFAIKVIKNKN